jgi:hypothetical protein
MSWAGSLSLLHVVGLVLIHGSPDEVKALRHLAGGLCF